MHLIGVINHHIRSTFQIRYMKMFNALKVRELEPGVAYLYVDVTFEDNLTKAVNLQFSNLLMMVNILEVFRLSVTFLVQRALYKH